MADGPNFVVALMRPSTFWLIFPGGGVTSEIFGGPLDSMISTTDPAIGSPVAFNGHVDRFVVCLPATEGAPGSS